MERAVWGKGPDGKGIEIKGMYEKGKNVFVKSADGGIYLRSLRNISRMKRVSELPASMQPKQKQPPVVVTGVASAHAREGPDPHQVQAQQGAQAGTPQTIQQCQQMIANQKQFLKLAQRRIMEIQHGTGQRGQAGDLEVWQLISKQATVTIAKVTKLAQALSEQGLKQRLHERNAAQSMHHHNDRSKLGQMQAMQ